MFISSICKMGDETGCSLTSLLVRTLYELCNERLAVLDKVLPPLKWLDPSTLLVEVSADRFQPLSSKVVSFVCLYSLVFEAHDF